MKKLKGIVPVLITPFNENQTVDYNSLVKVLKHLLSKNPGGLWVLGTGGEDMNLSFEERVKISQIVTEVVDGKIPIILGCGFYSKTDTKNFINASKSLNFDAYHLMPYHRLLSLEAYIDMYKEIANFSEKPLWLYTSANYCRHFPPNFFEELKDHGNIAGIKYSTSNIVHMEKAISYSSDSFQVISAVVRQFLASLTMGVKATTTVEACFYYDQIIRIYNAFESGDIENAAVFQHRLNRYLEKSTTGAASHNFFKVAEGKYFLSKKGICKKYMSGYYRAVNEQEQQYLDEILRASQLEMSY